MSQLMIRNLLTFGKLVRVAHSQNSPPWRSWCWLLAGYALHLRFVFFPPA